MAAGPRLVERWIGALAALVVTAVVAVAAYEMVTGRIIGTGDNVRTDIVWTLVPMAVVTVLLLLLAAVPAARGVTVAVVAVAIVLQAVPATRFYWPTGDPAKFYATSEGIELLQAELGHDRIATLGHAIRPNTTHYYGLRSLNGHAFVPSALASVFTAIDPRSFIGPTYSIFSPNVAQVADSPGLDRFGVRYLVAQADSVVPGFPGTPVPIPGVADPLDPAASTRAVVPGGIHVAQPGGGGAARRAHPARGHRARRAHGRGARRHRRRAGPEHPQARAHRRDEGRADGAVLRRGGGRGGTGALVGGRRPGRSRGDGDVRRLRGALRVQAVVDHPAGDPADDGLSVAFAGGGGWIIWSIAGQLPPEDPLGRRGGGDRRRRRAGSRRWRRGRPTPGRSSSRRRPHRRCGPAARRAPRGAILEDSGDRAPGAHPVLGSGPPPPVADTHPLIREW